MVDFVKLLYRYLSGKVRFLRSIVRQLLFAVRSIKYRNYNGYNLGHACRIGKKIKILGESVSIGNSSIIGDNVHVSAKNIIIGDHVVIEPNIHIEGLETVTIDDYSYISSGFFADGDGKYKLTIKENVWIGRNTHINVRREVVIGNNVGLGEGTQVWTHGYFAEIAEGFPYSFGSVIFEDNVWSTPGVIILPGVIIGHHSIITTGSVITKNLEPRCLYAGVPAILKAKEEKYRQPFTIEQKNELLLARLKDCFEMTQVVSGLYLTKVKNKKNIHSFHLLISDVFSEISFQTANEFCNSSELVVISFGIKDQYMQQLSDNPQISFFNISSKTYTKKGNVSEVAVKKCLGEYHMRFIRSQ